MDRRDLDDDRTGDRPDTEPRRGPASQAPWVRVVAVAIIALVVMATVASALLA